MNNGYIVVRDASLKEFNTMRIDSRADQLIFPFSVEGAIGAVLEYYEQQPILLGKGSNTIFSEGDYKRPVICSDMLRSITFRDHMIVSDTGASLSTLSWYALENSVSGFEFLEDIPGSVGGALYMNAGTYEDTIGEMVASVIIYDYHDKTVKELTGEQLAPWWGKRDSYFRHHPCFIIQALFDADRTGNYEEILKKMLGIKMKRYLKQPRNYPSAGSAFKRPYVDGEPRYIWKLFDEVGLRGYRIGDAQVSDKHPGFIINVGNATGKDVVNLMNYCKQVVLDNYGIKIEEEWQIV